MGRKRGCESVNSLAMAVRQSRAESVGVFAAEKGGAMTEPEFIASVEASNAKLFAAEKIQIKPDTLTQLLRRAYRAGKDEAEKKRGHDLFNGLFK